MNMRVNKMDIFLIILWVFVILYANVFGDFQSGVRLTLNLVVLGGIIGTGINKYQKSRK